MSEKVNQVSDSSFEKDVLQSSKPVLVDFWAEWCAPCRMLAPTIDAIAEQFGETAGVVKVNVDDNTATAQRYGIKGIPTLILFRDGKEVERVVGATSKEVDRAHDRKACRSGERLRTGVLQSDKKGDHRGPLFHVGQTFQSVLLSFGRQECLSSYARPATSPVCVLTRTISPSLMKSGTRTTKPVSTVACLLAPPAAVSPRAPISVETTASSTYCGSWSETGAPLYFSTCSESLL